MVQFLIVALNLFRRWFIWLWQQEGSPGNRARGLAVGIFCGCFPFFGLQTFLGIVLATVVKGNQLLAVAGTWVSNPLTYLPLYWFNYFIGSLILGKELNMSEAVEFNLAEMWNSGWLFITKLLLGSLVVGMISSLVIGITAFILLRQKSKHSIID